jgi:hypothetical protein
LESWASAAHCEFGVGTLVCLDDLDTFSILYGLREDGVAVVVVNNQKVVVAAAGKKE